jgi:uncharacterized membrane protein YphA (DoxX/SURF4 family)
MDLDFISLWCDRLIRFIIGSLFIVTGVMKLRDPEAFSVVINAFGIVPSPVTDILAIVLPIIEIIAGLGLVIDFPFSLQGVSALLIVFMGILLYGMHLGLDIDCGCYGPGDVESRAFGGLRKAFYRDTVMALGLFVLYARRAYITFFNKPLNTNELNKELS